MTSDIITAWQRDGETMERQYFGGSKITADVDCTMKLKEALMGRNV